MHAQRICEYNEPSNLPQVYLFDTADTEGFSNISRHVKTKPQA